MYEVCIRRPLYDISSMHICGIQGLSRPYILYRWGGRKNLSFIQAECVRFLIMREKKNQKRKLRILPL